MRSVVDPNARPDGFSVPVFLSEAAKIQAWFGSYPGYLEATKVVQALKQVDKYIYASDRQLLDRYVPLTTIHYRVGNGKIAVVFPAYIGGAFHEDYMNRTVTMHTMGDVSPDHAVEFTAQMVNCLKRAFGPPVFPVSAPTPLSLVAFHDRTVPVG